MYILIDLFIILFIILFTYLGYRKGLIKVTFSIISFIIAISISLILYKPISNIIIKNTDIDDNIRNTMVTSLSKKYGVTSNSKDLTLEVNSNQAKDLPDFIQDYIKNYTSEIVGNTARQVIEIFAEKLTVSIINLVVLLILYIIIRLLLLLVKSFLEILAELPILKQFDKLGGIILGLLKGLLMLYLLFAVLLLLGQGLGAAELNRNINKSYIGSFIYNNNILLNIIF